MADGMSVVPEAVAGVLGWIGLCATTYGTWAKDKNHGWEWMTGGFAALMTGLWLVSFSVTRYELYFIFLASVVTGFTALSAIAWHRQSLWQEYARQQAEQQRNK